MRRIALGAACLLAAVGLQWLVLHAAVRLLGQESIGRRASADPNPPVRWRAIEATRVSPAQPEPLALHPSVAPAPTAPTTATAAPAAPPRRPPNLPATLPGERSPRAGAAPDAPPDAEPSAERYHFYAAREVDVTAEPVLGWNVDTATLDALAVSRIVVTLFVGRDGSILYCSVDEPERLSPVQRRALAERLAATEMRPARLAGAPVPSRRRVEIYTVGAL